MLNVNPTSPRANLREIAANTAASAAANMAAHTASADPAGFASLLRQTQMAMPAQPPATAATPPKPAAQSDETSESTPETKATDDTRTAQESDTAQRTRALQKARLRAADGTRVAARDAAADAHGAVNTGQAGRALSAIPVDPTAKPDSNTQPDLAEKSDKAAKVDPADRNGAEGSLAIGTPPVDPNLAQWLAGLQRAAAGQTDAVPTGTDTGSAPEDTDTGRLQARGAAKGLRAAEDQRAGQRAEQKAGLTPGNAPSAEAIAANPFAAALAEQRTLAEPPRHAAGDGNRDLAAASASASTAASTATAGQDAAPPVAVEIAAPVTAPDFAQELGLRLSTLAKDGVQTAELHLNPADMGPVSVQIVMDGTQARIDFGADLAATRQAIEAGLPELASALADAGFTLAGGGCSPHAGDRHGGNGSGGAGADEPRRAVVEEQVKRVASAARRIVTKGGIDLFA